MTANYDYLMLACKLDEMEDWLDIQEDEAAIFRDILNYELTTTLVRIPAHSDNTIPTAPHMFLPGKLLDVKDVNRFVFALQTLWLMHLLMYVSVL